MAYYTHSQKMNNPEYAKYKAVKELIDRFNRGELDYLPEKDKEQIAMLAAQTGQKFNTPSKPVKKGLFDFADTALMGLVPNKWRPTSVGEEWHGESQSDKFAGGLGTVAGFGVPITGAYKGIQYGSKGAKNLWNMAGNKVGNLNPLRDSIISKGTNAASNAAEASSTAINALLQRALRNAPTPRTGSINNEIFGSAF